MKNNFELQYKRLISRILNNGDERQTRNSVTKALFGERLIIDVEEGQFPLLTSRKMFYKGVLGEFAAMIRGPKDLESFESQGCPYWKLWAKEDGSLNVDYGNTWTDFNGSGVNQMQTVIDSIKNNPTDRRMFVVGTNPQNNPDLPSCHILYQWFVREGKYLDMMWYQRSVDTLVGLPSDVVLAYAWNAMIAKDTGLTPGRITMNLGDTHIYESHYEKAREYIGTVQHDLPTFKFADTYKDLWNFTKNDIIIEDYKHEDPIKFELLA
jgi:thymidylate synthase